MSGIYQIYNPINNKRYIYAYKDASRQLKIDKGSIRYAFKFKNGRCDKIKATFVKITEKEYKNKSKK